MHLYDGRIIDHKRLNADCYRLTVAAPPIAQAARPGQFLHVRCGATYDPLLRRPISINTVNRKNGSVTMLYRVIGRGTALLAQKKVGEQVNVLGPLGQPFTFDPSYRKVALVAGGLGLAPLYFLLQELNIDDLVFFQGARSASEILLTHNIKQLAKELYLATDDGSAGFKGTVVELFVNQLAFQNFDIVYAAGPQPMLRALCLELKRNHIKGQVSLEERMGCGVGACLCCNVKIGRGNSWVYKRVCADGPVFDAEEVYWDDSANNG